MNIDIETVQITRHANKMALQRFNKYSNQTNAFFREVLTKGEYVGLTKNSTHLFTYKRASIILSSDCKKVVTVMVNHRQKQKKGI